MSSFSNQIHPLIRDGRSQSDRSLPALSAETVPIDGRGTADFLDFIYQYAKQVNHYDESLQVQDWLPFFEKSIPFQIARISRYDTQQSQGNYEALSLKTQERATFSATNPLLDFLLDWSFQIENWRTDLKEDTSGLKNLIENLIESNLSQALQQLITSVNAANQWGFQTKYNFYDLKTWGLNIRNFFAVDAVIANRKNSEAYRVQQLKTKLDELFQIYHKAIIEITTTAKEVLETSIQNNAAHDPHLGLLFTFLRLYDDVKNQLNELPNQHLDFFYKKVLRIETKKESPDKAHLIFELPNRIEQFKIDKNTLFKAGQDDTGVEIQYQLDEEIVVDKAQVESLKTLYLDYAIAQEHPCGGECLDPATNELKKQAIDIVTNKVKGVFMAPKANSADGIEEDFQGEEASSWRTLGAKTSKFQQEITNEKGEVIKSIKNHPFARLGLLLSSPILFLKEGLRVVTLKIICQQNVEPDCWQADWNDLFFEAIRTTYSITEEMITAIIEEDADPTFVQGLKDLLEAEGTIIINEDDSDEVKTIKTSILENKYSSTVENSACETTISQQSLYDALVHLSDYEVSDFEKDLINKFIKRNHAFQVQFNGEEEWLSPYDVVITIVEKKKTENTLDQTVIEIPHSEYFEICLHITIPETEPAITAYNSDVFGVDYQDNLPKAKLELRHDINVSLPLGMTDDKKVELQHINASLYEFFRYCKITDVTIDTEVTGVRDLLVQNNDSVQDAGKTFFPFSATPNFDSTFYIGSPEAFHKDLTAFNINVCWDALPLSLFEHYLIYNEGITRNSFKASVDILFRRNWLNLNPRKQLFKQVIDFDSNKLIAEIEETYVDNYDILDGQALAYLASNLDNYDINGNQFKIINRANNNVHLTSKNFDSPELTVEDAIIAFHAAVTTPKQTFSFDETEIGPIYRPSQMEEKRPFTPSAQNGFVRLQLKEKTFLHNQFASVLTTQATAFAINNRAIPGAVYSQISTPWITEPNITPSAGTHTVEQPKLPYTPGIKEISVDYQATASRHQIKLIHLHPFDGTYKKINIPNIEAPIKKENETDQEKATRLEQVQRFESLLPYFEEEGTLYVGLRELRPGSTVQLLFQLAESTADPYLDKAKINWAYLSNNQWKSLREDFEILEDASNGLVASGIVKINIPFDISKGNTIMPADLHWIKASASKRTTAVSETIAIHTQAAQVTYRPQGNDPKRLEQALPAETIAKPVEHIAAIKSIVQAYPSFGGIPQEASSRFRTRVSEHLRHKDRAITLYDYERLILENFPSIFKVKCITHTLGKKNRNLCDHHLSPGFITIPVIPDLTNLSRLADRLEPKATVALLEDIQQFLKQRNSPFVRLRVLNPKYEKINLKGDVQFKKGLNANFYLEELKKDILQFFSPWAFGEIQQISFGGKVFKSSVLNFIESRTYIDYVINFQMFSSANPLVDSNEIAASTARSILVSGLHQFQVNDCRDAVPNRSPNMKGLGYMKIEKGKGLGSFRIPR